MSGHAPLLFENMQKKERNVLFLVWVDASSLAQP